MKHLLLLILLLTFQTASACDCQMRLLNQEYTNAALVIHGFVLSEKIYELEQSRTYLDSLEEKIGSKKHDD